MGGILTSLNSSYTGLQAHQTMVDVAGNNIANASDEFYSRQRAVLKPQNSINKGDYSVGTGVQVQSVVRAHDEFVFQRYGRAAQEKEFYQTQFDKLREVSSFFQDLEGSGIYQDLQEYFNAWKDLAKNGKDPAQKQVLLARSQTLIKNIKNAYNNLAQMQQKSSEELALRIEEVNRIGSQIANINAQLNAKESRTDLKHANDLRDQRDKLEFQLRELIGGNAYKSNLKSDIGSGSRDVDYGTNYVFNIAGGYNIIDGSNFHPLGTKQSRYGNRLNHIYFQTQDHRPVDITNQVLEGKIGALAKMSADGIDGSNVGKIQEYLNLLDTFVRGFVSATNNIYAQSATQSLRSMQLSLKGDQPVLEGPYNLQRGSFDLVMYDSNGEKIGAKNIVLSSTTTMKDIVKQINANVDDNGDKNSLNDVDDLFSASYDEQTGEFQITSKNQENIYIGLSDNGTNLPGAFGLNRFFDGNSVQTLAILKQYEQDPSQIKAWTSPVEGNVEVANLMQQLQYENVAFDMGKNNTEEMQIAQFYQLFGNTIATQTQEVKATLDSKKALFSATQKEYLSISQVSVDEEMVNLIKYQSGYAANAKVVSTVDKMIDTLLGIKQ